MRHLLSWHAGVIVLLLAAIWLNTIWLIDRSMSYNGPEFRAVSTEEAAEVSSGIHHQLEFMGFKQEFPPQADATPAHSGEWDEPQTFRYVKKGEGGNSVRVEVFRKGASIKTRIGWKVRGRKKDARLANLDAANAGITLDDWFNARMETSLISPNSRALMRKELQYRFRALDSE